MPDWVYLGLWGINSRKAAMAYLTVSVILTLGAVALALSTKDYFLFIVVLAPIWYWAAIKWADNDAAWN